MSNNDLLNEVIESISSKYNRSKNQVIYLLKEVFDGNVIEYLEYEEWVKKNFPIKVCYKSKYDYLIDKANLEIKNWINGK
jgi:hypothetical protein